MGNLPYDFFLINPHIAKTTNTPEDMYGDVIVLTNTVFIHFLINERVRSTYNVSLHITELIFLLLQNCSSTYEHLLVLFHGNNRTGIF